MKKTAKKTILIILGAVASVCAMDDKGWASIYESLAAFEDRANPDPSVARFFNRPGYVKPIIDNLGNVLNSNWYVSASVPQSFTFEAGLPISLIPIGSDDQKFTEVDEFGDPEQVPTIFGTHGDPDSAATDWTIYGNETLNGLGFFTYPYLQLGASFYHARAVLRFMALPSISELQGFNLFGFGLQYSFGHLFRDKLPPAAQGLDVSLVFGYNTSSISYQPEDYDGSLDLDITALTFDAVIGYKPVKFVEAMLTLGYQYANMESSGKLTCQTKENNQPVGYYGQTINPNISVKGNNGFKFGIAVAFQLGTSFHPVVGFDYAGKSSFTTNILYFRQQFGEDDPVKSKNTDDSKIDNTNETAGEAADESAENDSASTTDEGDSAEE